MYITWLAISTNNRKYATIAGMVRNADLQIRQEERPCLIRNNWKYKIRSTTKKAPAFFVVAELYTVQYI